MISEVIDFIIYNSNQTEMKTTVNLVNLTLDPVQESNSSKFPRIQYKTTSFSNCEYKVQTKVRKKIDSTAILPSIRISAETTPFRCCKQQQNRQGISYKKEIRRNWNKLIVLRPTMHSVLNSTKFG